MSFNTLGSGLPKMPSAGERSSLGFADETLGSIDEILHQHNHLRDTVTKSFHSDRDDLHGPVHPEFGFESDIDEIYRAVEDNRLSPEDARRIIDILESAPNQAAAEDALVLEFYRGETSPDYQQFHDRPSEELAAG